MTQTVTNHHGTNVLALPTDGPMLTEVADFLDLIGDAFGNDAELVAIPVSRLPVEFFRLRSKLAGEVTQKFVSYHTRLAVVGDLSQHTADSEALSAFVTESNRGGQLWFVADEDALDERLAQQR